MSWTSLAIRWPEQATGWMDLLKDAKDAARGNLLETGLRLSGLDGLATTDPSTIGEVVKNVVASGRAALDAQFGEIPKCIVVTPFQSGVGQGSGYQRFLSAPNVLQHLAAKLDDATDAARPQGEQYALVLLFLGTGFDVMANALSKFNALLPIADLQRAERRARNLVKLESEKLQIQTAGMQPQWADMPLESCTVVKTATQSFNGQLAMMESYASDSSPLADLASLAQRKAQQAVDQDQRLTDLKALLENGDDQPTVQARLIGPGDTAELRKQLLEGDDAPGHEWVLSSGLMLVGSKAGLSFVQELIGL
ncbi:hypothetical protein [Pseudomonas sp. F3-2]|uniref:hypothetical protein n=1 Tax=Pseudomonas sp. F3-2 TaxID=3141539 RepID=UPI00315DC2D0